jgi:hypothetical protein
LVCLVIPIAPDSMWLRARSLNGLLVCLNVCNFMTSWGMTSVSKRTVQWSWVWSRIYSHCALLFFNIQHLFARDLNTYTSVPESTKIVPVQPIYMPNTRCARDHVAPSSGDGRFSIEKIVTKEKTLQ